MIYHQVMHCTTLVNYNNFWDQVSKTNKEPSYNASIIISSMYGTRWYGHKKMPLQQGVIATI